MLSQRRITPCWVTVATRSLRNKRKTRRPVRTKFVGLFDTVEAFGVPIEEFRRAIDYVIWPISFRSTYSATRSTEHAMPCRSMTSARHFTHCALIWQTKVQLTRGLKRSGLREYIPTSAAVIRRANLSTCR